MPRYNVLGIARHTVPRATLKDVLKRATGFVIESGGMVESVDNYGQKQLPYRIGQVAGTGPRAEYGVFFGLRFIAKPEVLKDISVIFRDDEFVLRSHVERLPDEKLFKDIKQLKKQAVAVAQDKIEASAAEVAKAAAAVAAAETQTSAPFVRRGEV